MHVLASQRRDSPSYQVQLLLQLAKSLGCSYFSELEIAQNANYTSHHMIDEFLTVLSDCVEQDLLSEVKASPAVVIVCDESTDIANLSS